MLLKLTVLHLTEGRQEAVFGDHQTIRNWIDLHVPEAETARSLEEAVAVANKRGDLEVKVEPYRPNVDPNQIPEDYLKQAEDPWIRHG
jgi:hypothetical protein